MSDCTRSKLLRHPTVILKAGMHNRVVLLAQCILELKGEIRLRFVFPDEPLSLLLSSTLSSNFQAHKTEHFLVMAYRTVWLALLGIVTAQTTTEPTTSTSAASNSSSSPTPTTPSIRLDLNLDDVWDLLIGPVEVAETTTIYSPTPVPSSSLIPPPPIYYSPFPSGQQVPFMKNESWSFPQDFWYVHGTCCSCDVAVSHVLPGGELLEPLSRSKVRQRMKAVVPAYGMLCLA
jgi:hypothetical protein